MRAFDTKSGNTYFHNGDFSGDVSWEFFQGGSQITATIPFEDMKELVAEYLRSERIEQLENMSTEEILEGNGNLPNSS